MKKWIVFLLSASLFMVLAACSTPEADEVLDYHNDFVDDINPKLEELDQKFDEMNKAETDEEAFYVEQNDVTPLVKEIKEYFDGKDPAEDVTKEYHKLRSSWADNYYEAIQTQNDAYETLLNGNEEDADDLFAEAETQMSDATDYDQKATEKWDDIMDGYNFEEEEAA